MPKKQEEKKIEPLTLKIKPDSVHFINMNRYYSMTDINVFAITGGRGIGKTTGVMIHCVQDYINNGDEFIYVRRYKPEIIKAKSLLDSIANRITTKGLGPGTFEYQYQGVRIGYGTALTVQQSLKSGVDFSKVKTLIFDEYVLPPAGAGRYLPNEIELIFELISTVFRARKDYRIFFLGNNTDMFNPLFAYFNVPIFKFSYCDKKRGLYCEMAKTKEELRKIEEETPLYKLTYGTNYAKYHYDNEVLSTVNGVIGKKNPKAELMCRLIYNGQTLNIYRNKLDELFIEHREKRIDDDISLELVDNNRPNYLNIDIYRHSQYKSIIDICYYAKKLIFNSQKAIQLLDYIMEVL